MTAGLVLESQDGGKRPYDRFRARAVFPILNDGGRVVAFGARSLALYIVQSLVPFSRPATPLGRRARRT